MSTLQNPSAAVRVSFRLGSWRSPRSRGWQGAYDLMVQELCDAGVPIYGILEADLAGRKEGTSYWRKRFAANAAEVVARGKCDAGLGDPIYAVADGVVVFRQFRFTCVSTPYDGCQWTEGRKTALL